MYVLLSSARKPTDRVSLAVRLAKGLETAEKMLQQANDHLSVIEEEIRTGTLGPVKLEEWKEREREWLVHALNQRHGKSKRVLEEEMPSPYQPKEEARKRNSRGTSG